MYGNLQSAHFLFDLGIDFDGQLIMFLRSIFVTHQLIDQTQVVMRLGHFGIDPNGLVERNQGIMIMLLISLGFFAMACRNFSISSS